MVIEELQDEQSAQLLAQANLHRLRRQWDEAVTCCMQVLYHAPDNWRAHALLGDIYADQDRPDEAIQWYCMTLEIRPESNSAREKLSRLVNSRRREIVRSIDPTRPYIDRFGNSYSSGALGKLLFRWRSPERRQQLVLAALVFAGLTLATSPLWLGDRGRAPHQPVFSAGPVPTSAPLLQPVAPSPKTSPAPTATVPATPQPAAASVQPSAVSPIVRDTSDQRLTDSLAQDAGLRGISIQVTDAQANPAASSLTVTYLSSAAPPSQQRILQDSLAVARAALVRPEASYATACTVRCLSAPGAQSGSEAVIVFQGTVARSSLSTAAPSQSKLYQDQPAAMFTDTWWSPALQQQPTTPKLTLKTAHVYNDFMNA